MKILKLEAERLKVSRKLKNPKLDQKMIAKIGSGMYLCDGVREVSISVAFKNGTSVNYKRCEEDDEFEEFKSKRKSDE